MKISLLLLLSTFIAFPHSSSKEEKIKVLQVLNRFYVQDIEQAVNFYENILQEKCSLRFQYKEVGLELAQVGNILILAGSEKALEPFRETKATFIVNSIQGFKDYLLKNGATIIRDIKEVPTGQNMTVRHTDGTIIEYVQFKETLE